MDTFDYDPVPNNYGHISPQQPFGPFCDGLICNIFTARLLENGVNSSLGEFSNRISKTSIASVAVIAHGNGS